MASLIHYLIVCMCASSCVSFLFENQIHQKSWQEVFDTKGIHIGSNRVKRFVKLDDDQPNVPHQKCVLPDGKDGHCRHVRHCILDVFRNDFLKFMDYLCIINRMSIGACCPDSQEDITSEGLAGDLPQTADETEDPSLLRISKAENRGLTIELGTHLDLTSFVAGVNNQGCGVSTLSRSKLVGAHPADPKEWPWMAAIMAPGREPFCGGVLITDRHVLTAAHCTRRYKAEDLKVRLGEYDFSKRDDSRTFNFQVVEIRQHVDFDVPTYHNDICILKLHRPTTFNTYVWPICLPPPGMDFTNKSSTIIGWGTEWYGGPASDVLMEVSVPVWPQQRCVEAFTQPIFNESICAGDYKGGHDACQGDSGGPLMYKMESGRWVAIGVVSWGVNCGEPNHPGVYTRVQKYLTWIVDNANF